MQLDTDDYELPDGYYIDMTCLPCMKEDSILQGKYKFLLLGSTIGGYFTMSTEPHRHIMEHNYYLTDYRNLEMHFADYVEWILEEWEMIAQLEIDFDKAMLEIKRKIKKKLRIGKTRDAVRTLRFLLNNGFGEWKSRTVTKQRNKFVTVLAIECIERIKELIQTPGEHDAKYYFISEDHYHELKHEIRKQLRSNKNTEEILKVLDTLPYARPLLIEDND